MHRIHGWIVDRFHFFQGMKMEGYEETMRWSYNVEICRSFMSFFTWLHYRMCDGVYCLSRWDHV